MQDLMGSSLYSGNSPGETEMEIMRSRMVMTQVVRELGLQTFAYPRPLPVLGLIPRRLRLPDPGLDMRCAPISGATRRSLLGELEVPDRLGWARSSLCASPGRGNYSADPAGHSRVDGRLRERLAQTAIGSVAGHRAAGRAGRARIPSRPHGR
jgi:tyrosine-protein kinase Etk/Wzc